MTSQLNNIYLADNYYPTSTSSPFYLLCQGDTLTLMTQRTPASSTDTGFQGEICWDSNNLYICVSNNNWKKLPLQNIS